MGIDLYHAPTSGPGWAVRLTAAALGVELTLKVLDHHGSKEHLSPEFTKLNPQHTVPTLVDDGFPIWESRTISRYLVNKYGAGSGLYPEDPKARALVDLRLDFDLGTLSARFAQYFYPLIQGAPADEDKLKKLQEALGFLNTFLEDSQYAAGPELTLADLSLVCTVSTIELVGISLDPYLHIQTWMALVKSTAVGYEDIIVPSVEFCKGQIEKMMSKKRTTLHLYHAPSSPPSWPVRLAAAALGLELNLKTLDYDAKEHMAADFLKLNPQHTVPTLVDDGFSIWESRTILRYLVNKYGAGSSLYPQDPQARALVDLRLDFDIGTLNARFTQYFYPIAQGAPADEDKLKKLQEALGFLNTFLDDSQYAAGPELTLADLSLLATIKIIELAEISVEAYPNILTWLELVKSSAAGYDDIIVPGVEICKEKVNKMLGK